MIKEMRIMITAWVRSIYDSLKVMVLMMLVWTIFSIFGMNLYQDKLHFCQHSMNFGVNKNQCQAMGLSWINYEYNFDNVLNSLPTLFIVYSFDKWGEIMQIGYNSVAVDQGPLPLYNYPLTFLFYVLYIFFGSILFIGITNSMISNNFKNNNKKLQNKCLN